MCLNFVILHVCQKPKNLYYFFNVFSTFVNTYFCCISTTVSDHYISNPVYYKSNSSFRKKKRSLQNNAPNCQQLHWMISLRLIEEIPLWQRTKQDQMNYLIANSDLLSDIKSFSFVDNFYSKARHLNIICGSNIMY